MQKLELQPNLSLLSEQPTAGGDLETGPTLTIEEVPSTAG